MVQNSGWKHLQWQHNAKAASHQHLHLLLSCPFGCWGCSQERPPAATGCKEQLSPELQGCLVSMTALSQLFSKANLACIQTCMLHVHVQHLLIYTHKQAHTKTHFHWPKNSQELFSNKDTAHYWQKQALGLEQDICDAGQITAAQRSRFKGTERFLKPS